MTTLAVPGGTGVMIGPAGAFVGFTVTGAVADFGAAIAVSGVGTLIRDNVFDGNVQTAGGFGAAIGGNSASPVIDRNVFRNNSCDAQFLSAVVAFVNSSSPGIINNLFVDNPCRAINMTLPEGSAPLVVNNTLVGNQTGVRVDARVPTAQQVYRNNVVVGNEIGLEVEFGDGNSNPTWDHNFDATARVDKASLTFGRTGNESSLVRCNQHGRDENGDGLLDQVCHFAMQRMGSGSVTRSGSSRAARSTGPRSRDATRS